MFETGPANLPDSGGYGKNPHTVIAIDEAHVFAPRQKTLSTVSEAANLFRRTRSCGIHVLLTSHSPILMDQMLLSNLSMVVNVGVTSESDNRLLADVMALDHRQIEQMKSIRVEQAIVKCDSLPPQLVTVPNQNCSSTNPKDLIAPTLAGMKRLEIHPVIEWPDKRIQAKPTVCVDPVKLNATTLLKRIGDAELSGDPLGKTRQKIRAVMRMKDREYLETEKYAVQEGFIVGQEFQTNPHGRSLFLNLTQKAVDELKAIGYQGLRENVEHVSEPHWATVQAIRKYYAADDCLVRREAVLETNVPGRSFRCDAIIEFRSGEKIIVEVILSNEPADVVGLIEGLRVQLNHFDFLMLVVEKKSDQERMLNHIKKNCPDLMEVVSKQIQWRCAYDFFTAVEAGMLPDNKQAKRGARR